MTRALIVALVALAACGTGTSNPGGAGGAGGQVASGGMGGGLAGAGGAAGGLGGAGGASVPPCPEVAGATIAITGICLYDCRGGKTDGGLLTGPLIPLCQLSTNQAEALGVFSPAYCVTTTTDPRCE
jgi:hypothetical protein